MSDETMPDRVKELEAQNAMLKQQVRELEASLKTIKSMLRGMNAVKQKLTDSGELIARSTKPLPGRKRNHLDIE